MIMLLKHGIHKMLLISINVWISWMSFAIADMKIEITSGVNTAYPIAVIPFTSINKNDSHNTVADITSIIASDLRNSGKFNTLPIEYLPHQPTQVADILPMFWEKIGITTIVIGSINYDYDNHYTIAYQLIDAAKNPALIILENQYSVQKQWLRYTAHTISNEIFEKITGIKGAFCTRIAYVLYKNDSKNPYELCISDYDGHNQKLVCQSSEPLMSPAWSPDGKKLAYVTFASGCSELIVQTLDTGFVDKIIRFPNHNGAPAFSPDGKKLAFSLSKTGSLNLYIMDLISGKIHQLTSNRYNNTEPSWFPDSQSLAYTSDQGGVPQVYKININKNNDAQRLSWLHKSNQHPKVSMDGNHIIMVNRNQGKQNISRLNFLTNKEEILTKNSFLADTPSLSPNGTMIIYSTVLMKDAEHKDLLVTTPPMSSSDHEESVLELISIDGGLFKAYLKGSAKSIRFPSWSSF